MRFTIAVLFLVASSGAAFAPNGQWGIPSRSPNVAFSTVEAEVETSVGVAAQEDDSGASAVALSAAEINSRLETQLVKLREKDSSSPQLSEEDIKVAFEDEHILVVDKPSGVLCVPGKGGNPNLAQAVYDSFGADLDRADKMVVHRLGMDTSGLVIFAKNINAVRGMNAIFRTRKIDRTYEALVCGHLEQDAGIISLPLMRDYEFPPFMRVSTDKHQNALVGLDASEVGKKLLQQPKDSLTKYEVVAREELDGQPVTRVSLTSISGRTHQLNVHLAAFGHPIVGDSTYGVGGDAAPNGGLDAEEQDELAPNSSRASAEVQKALASQGKVCVHAKSLKFRHPVTKEEVSVSCDAPF